MGLTKREKIFTGIFAAVVAALVIVLDVPPSISPEEDVLAQSRRIVKQLGGTYIHEQVGSTMVVGHIQNFGGFSDEQIFEIVQRTMDRNGGRMEKDWHMRDKKRWFSLYRLPNDIEYGFIWDGHYLSVIVMDNVPPTRKNL